MRTIVVNDPRFTVPKLVLGVVGSGSPVLMVPSEMAANEELLGALKASALMKYWEREGLRGCSASESQVSIEGANPVKE